MADVDGSGSFDNPTTKKLVREQLFKAGVRLAEILNTVSRDALQIESAFAMAAT